MILGEAAPPERLAARALEIEAGRVHEHDVERGQKVAPAANSSSSRTSFTQRGANGVAASCWSSGSSSPSHAIAR